MFSPEAASVAPLTQIRSTPMRWIALAIAAVTCVVLYLVWPYQHWQFAERGSVMEGWGRLLWIEPEWYFCYLVPGIVAFLVYRLHPTLAALPLQGSWVGLPVAATSLFFYWIGYKVDTGYMGFVSIQLMVAALILLVGGRAWMRALFFPWLFLLFMWPMFPLEGLLASPLRLLTAKMSSGLLNVVGVPVVRAGTGLYSAPDFARHLQEGDRFMLDVADPCSGIRSLFALVMIAALYGHLALKRTLPRLLLFLSAMPMAVAGNLVRLMLLAVGSIWFGQNFAIGKVEGGVQYESTYHEGAGFVVFAVALGGMFALASFFERRHWKKIKWLDAAVTTGSDEATETSRRSVLMRVGSCAALSGLALLTCAFTSTTVKLADPGLIMELPPTVGAYQGIAMEMSSKEKRLFYEGVTLKRRKYFGPGSQIIWATLVMSGPVKKSLHEPSVCLPDQGWTIVDSDVVNIKLTDGREQRATLMEIYRDTETAAGQRVREHALNIFWYQGSHGVSTPSYVMSHARTYVDALLHNLNHRWGQVSLYMSYAENPIGQDDPLQGIVARETLKDFVARLTPKILAE